MQGVGPEVQILEGRFLPIDHQLRVSCRDGGGGHFPDADIALLWDVDADPVAGLQAFQRIAVPLSLTGTDKTVLPGILPVPPLVFAKGHVVVQTIPGGLGCARLSLALSTLLSGVRVNQPCPGQVLGVALLERPEKHSVDRDTEFGQVRHDAFGDGVQRGGDDDHALSDVDGVRVLVGRSEGVRVPCPQFCTLMGSPVDVLNLFGAEGLHPRGVIQRLGYDFAGRHVALQFQNYQITLPVHGEDVDSFAMVGLHLGGEGHQVGVNDPEVGLQRIFEGNLLIQSRQLYRFGLGTELPDGHFDGHTTGYTSPQNS